MNEVADGWPLSLRLAHWLTAALVLTALGLGTSMVLLVHNPATRFELTQTHKSIGIAILALTVLRRGLRRLTRVPKPEPAARPLLLAAKAAHVALYALLTLSGWLMATTTAGTGADVRLRLVRVAISLGIGPRDLRVGPRRTCRIGKPAGLAHRSSRWRRLGARAPLPRSNAGAHVVEAARNRAICETKKLSRVVNSI